MSNQAEQAREREFERICRDSWHGEGFEPVNTEGGLYLSNSWDDMVACPDQKFFVEAHRRTVSNVLAAASTRDETIEEAALLAHIKAIRVLADAFAEESSLHADPQNAVLLAGMSIVYNKAAVKLEEQMKAECPRSEAISG
jgi:hypothetical protein